MKNKEANETRVEIFKWFNNWLNQNIEDDSSQTGTDQDHNDANTPHWISVRDREVIMPSKSSYILVTDGRTPSVTTVSHFLDVADKAYCQWTHWMKIPKLQTESHI